MNTMHQKVYHEEHGPVRKVVVDMEEEPVHRVLKEGEEKVSKDIQRCRFCNGGDRYRGNERQGKEGVLSEGR